MFQGMEVRMSSAHADQESQPETGPATLTTAEIWAMLKIQRKVIAAFVVVVVLLALVGSLLSKKQYRSTAVIQISAATGQEVRLEGVKDYDREAQERTFAKTQLGLLSSRSIREEVIRRNEKMGFTDLTIENNGAAKLARMLSATPRPDTELVDIAILDTDPERAARLANLVTEAYRENNILTRQNLSREAKAWLGDQLSEYKQRIIDENEALIAYEGGHDLADAEEEVTQLSATMDSLNRAYGDVNTQRVLLETTVLAHERLKAIGAYESLAKDMNTPLVSALTEEYSNAATENAKISARYLQNMPERVVSEARLHSIDVELRKEVERTLASEKAQLGILRSKEASIAAESDAAKKRLLGRQKLHGEYERLRLNLERSKQFYSTLSQRDGELELTSRTQLNNVHVIDEARPELKVVSPNIPRNLAMALALGLILGSVLGFLIEYADNTISSPEHVSTYLRVPFLGIVPRLTATEDDRDRAMYTFANPRSPASEAVRAIRTVIEFNPSVKSLKRLMVTSSVPSEGKTNTIVSLAVSFASLGRRVLLIDADMRRPRMHHIFEVPKDFGLSSVLKGSSLDAATLPTGIPGLDILPAGPRTEGPNELLASQAMADLLNELDRRYDLVMIDTPPSGMLSDAAILSKLVDGVIFVVREQTVSRRLVRDVVYRLQQVDAPILGVIVNDVDLSRRATKYKYYYDYDYRYEADNKPDAAAK